MDTLLFQRWWTNMNCENKTVLELVELLKTRKITSRELTEYYLNQIEKFKDKNAILEVFYDCLDRADECDRIIAQGGELPALIGVPILIKDNIFYKGHISSSGSKMLEHFVAPYNASIIEKLLDAGVVILGRTNMDEFAMGGSCENSAFGPCKNAYDDTRVSGGSSGGSAVSVALDMCAFALGSDTGGSIRQPASFNGVCGLKVTYGRVSRYGLCAFADSLDTVGLFTKDVKDSAYILNLVAGEDNKDNTSSDANVDNYLEYIKNEVSDKNIAIIDEVQALVDKTPYSYIYEKTLNVCKKYGAKVVHKSIPNFEKVLPIYYTIAPAEASSNMGRFDGVKYTSVCGQAETIDDLYSVTRSNLLGKEVKRRIMLGNFVLSSKQYATYYLKAKNLAKDIANQVKNILKTCDVIFMPTTYGEAFEIGSKVSDPISMYIEDMFTVGANIVGVPAMSVPIGKGKNGLPIGLQILSSHFNEKEIFNMADFILNHRGEL